MSATRPGVVLCADLADGDEVEAVAAAVAVAAAARADEEGEGGVLLLDLRPRARRPRGTLLATAEARELEAACRRVEGLRGAARGRVCRAVAVPGEDGSVEAEQLLEAAAESGAGLLAESGAGLVVAIAEPGRLRALLERAGGEPAVLISAGRHAPRPLLALWCPQRSPGPPRPSLVPPLGPSDP